ncbi:MAG: hypothetical protein HYY31_01340 [Chloroflexi bacterium]|nr:hypothetical protein [Chloroflexota bacterium]
MAIRRIRVRIGDRWYVVQVRDLGKRTVEATVDDKHYLVEVEDPTTGRSATERPRRVLKPVESVGVQATLESGDKTVRCPMPGRIVAVSVQEGQEVREGQEVCVLEAMKMEQSIRASQIGTVHKVFIAPGLSVQAGEPLIELE